MSWCLVKHRAALPLRRYNILRRPGASVLNKRPTFRRLSPLSGNDVTDDKYLLFICMIGIPFTSIPDDGHGESPKRRTFVQNRCGWFPEKVLSAVRNSILHIICVGKNLEAGKFLRNWET